MMMMKKDDDDCLCVRVCGCWLDPNEVVSTIPSWLDIQKEEEEDASL